jgi:hypothetical protein
MQSMNLFPRNHSSRRTCEQILTIAKKIGDQYDASTCTRSGIQRWRHWMITRRIRLRDRAHHLVDYALTGTRRDVNDFFRARDNQSNGISRIASDCG